MIPCIATYSRVAPSSPHGPTVAVTRDRLIERVQSLYPESLIVSYLDEGPSTSPEKRPSLRAMLRSAEAGDFNLIMIPALSDLSRSIHDLGSILSRLQDAGVRLQTLDGMVDTSATSGRLLCEVAMAMVKQEHSITGIRERIRNARNLDPSPGS